MRKTKAERKEARDALAQEMAKRLLTTGEFRAVRMGEDHSHVIYCRRQDHWEYMTAFQLGIRALTLYLEEDSASAAHFHAYEIAGACAQVLAPAAARSFPSLKAAQAAFRALGGNFDRAPLAAIA